MNRGILDHTAPSPYRYRVLVPFLLQPITAVAGHFMADELAFRRIYDVYYLLAFVSLLQTLRWYLRLWYTDQEALIGALLVAATLPITLRNNFFEPASFIEPSLLTIALVWTYRGAVWRVLPLTVLGSFVRETAVFIPIACWFAASTSSVKIPRGTPTAMALVSLILSTAVFAGLRWRFGEGLHVTLADVWAINTGREGFLAAVVNVALFLGGAGWILVLVGYGQAPQFVRRAMRFAPIYVAAVAIGGVWYEVRLLMLLYPVLVPCAMAALFPIDASRLSR
ncbi:MAG: hypothetical protein ACRD2I_01700 [Vicinamibacterales bacterium]